VRRAIELISDLVISSQFPANELNKEREVVADEINSYLDTPSEAVYDDFEDLMFAGSALGHNILGTVDAISGFTQDVCRQYLKDYYTAENMVLFYMGKTKPDKIFSLAENYFSTLVPKGVSRQRVMPIVQPQFDEVKNLGSHQSHTIIGAHLPGLYSEMRYPIALFANLLGGPGMNSLLNVALRERRGLVYNVEASTAMFTDAGALMIYFGCDPDDLTRCRNIVRQTLDRMIDGGLSVRAIEAAKKQYLGQLAVASDNREQVALSLGRSMMYFGDIKSPDDIKNQILAITPDDVRQVAEMMSADKCSILTME
jgi:predicted Zn-dependent peptidase